jgi:hypothetical protein
MVRRLRTENLHIATINTQNYSLLRVNKNTHLVATLGTNGNSDQRVPRV